MCVIDCGVAHGVIIVVVGNGPEFESCLHFT